jgi:hypothetical protein
MAESSKLHPYGSWKRTPVRTKDEVCTAAPQDNCNLMVAIMPMPLMLVLRAIKIFKLPSLLY